MIGVDILKTLSLKNIVGIFLVICISGCLKPPATETNIGRYPEILAEWKPNGLVGHFPDAIPESATNVVFSANPGFLQGGSWMQLRAKLSPQETREIYDSAPKISRQYYDGGNTSYHLSGTPDIIKDRLASTFFYTSGSKDDKFPKDYRIFVFDAQPSGYDPDPDRNIYLKWDHGTSRGVAVSLERSEVVYWAESW